MTATTQTIPATNLHMLPYYLAAWIQSAVRDIRGIVTQSLPITREFAHLMSEPTDFESSATGRQGAWSCSPTEGVLKPDIPRSSLNPNPLYRDVLSHYGAVAFLA